jgi:hypothetical protein
VQPGLELAPLRPAREAWARQAANFADDFDTVL